MKIFLSWSGDCGKALARVFHEFLHQHLQIQSFFSEEMRTGTMWASRLKQAVQETDYSLIFLTPESLTSHWLLFESGALWSRESVRIAALLCGIPRDHVPDPLEKFQNRLVIGLDTGAAEEEINRLFSDINKARPVETQLSDNVFDLVMKERWPVLKVELDGLRKDLAAPTEIVELKKKVSHLEERNVLLANSVQSPAYFQDEHFNILYANEAADLVFGLDVPAWSFVAVKDFLDSIRGILTNHAAVEQHFRQTHCGTAAPPLFDTEEILLSHPVYGRMVLKKLGLGVPDSGPRGPVSGWVVTLNIVSIERSELYYHDLELRLRGYMRRAVEARSRVAQKWGSGPRPLSVKDGRGARPHPQGLRYGGYSGFDLVVSTDLSEKETCNQLMQRQLLTPDYGLEDLKFLPDEIKSMAKNTFLAAHEAESMALVGTYRLSDCDLSSFSNLNDAAVDFQSQGNRVVDVGAYIERRGRRVRVFEGLFLLMVRFLLEPGEPCGVYIQVQEQNVSYYNKIGFEVAGTPFTVDGWAPEWVPMLMRIDEVAEQYADLEFREKWEAKTGKELAVDFWSRVMRHVGNDEQWTGSVDVPRPTVVGGAKQPVPAP